MGLALTNNEKVPPPDRPKLIQSYTSTVLVMDYLADILLIVCVFALLGHREKILAVTPPVVRRTKMMCDTVLTATLLVFGMAWAGLRTTAATSADSIQRSFNVYLAYHYLLLVVAVYIEVSSIILHIRTRGSPVNNHKIIFLTTVIVAPLFIIYALYSIIL